MPAQQGNATPTFTTIDVPGATGTFPTSINTAGAIAGTYTTSTSEASFVRATDGTITTFVAPGGIEVTYTYPAAINDAGTIAGYYTQYVNTGESGFLPVTYGFARAADGTFTTFSAPGAGEFCTSFNMSCGTYVTGINAAGTITGYYIDSNLENHGFVGNPAGTLTSFDACTPPGTIATSINAAGVVAGYCGLSGFLRAADGTITLFNGPTDTGAAGESINAAGAVTGYYTATTGSAYQSFVRAASGAITAFAAADAGTGPAQGTYAVSINAQGIIAGYFLDSSAVHHGFLRSASGTITSFEAPGADRHITYVGTVCTGISHSNAVTGWYVDSTGMTHGFLLTP